MPSGTARCVSCEERAAVFACRHNRQIVLARQFIDSDSGDLFDNEPAAGIFEVVHPPRALQPHVDGERRNRKTTVQ